MRDGLEKTLLVIAYITGKKLNIVPSILDHVTVEYTVQATLSFIPTDFREIGRPEVSFDDVKL